MTYYLSTSTPIVNTGLRRLVQSANNIIKSTSQIVLLLVKYFPSIGTGTVSNDPALPLLKCVLFCVLLL